MAHCRVFPIGKRVRTAFGVHIQLSGRALLVVNPVCDQASENPVDIVHRVCHAIGARLELLAVSGDEA